MMRFIDEPSAETCNAKVTDQRSGKPRPCRLLPREVGESGRLLCRQHLNLEAKMAAFADDVAEAERFAGRLGAALGVGVAVNANSASGILTWGDGGWISYEISLSRAKAERLLQRLT